MRITKVERVQGKGEWDPMSEQEILQDKDLEEVCGGTSTDEPEDLPKETQENQVNPPEVGLMISHRTLVTLVVS